MSEDINFKVVVASALITGGGPEVKWALTKILRALRARILLLKPPFIKSCIRHCASARAVTYTQNDTVTLAHAPSINYHSNLSLGMLHVHVYMRPRIDSQIECTLLLAW